MPYKIGNKYIKLNSKYISAETPVVLVYMTRSEGYPQNLGINSFPNSYYLTKTPGYSIGNIAIKASEATSVTINFGDGTIVKSDFVLVGTGDYRFAMSVQDEALGDGYEAGRIPAHIYTDGLIEHKVSFTFTNKSVIISVATNLIRLFRQYPEQVSAFNNLKAFQLTYPIGITSLPLSFTTNKSIENFILSGTNVLGSRIPDEILSLPLKALTVSGSVNLSDVNASNMKGLIKLKSTLLQLSISGCLVSELPTEFSQFEVITSLTVDSNRFTSPPIQINSLTTLTYISLLGGFSGSTYLEGWGDLSNLINLTTISIAAGYVPKGNLFTTTLPTYFGNFTKLKAIAAQGTFWQTQVRCDEFVTNFYNKIITIASLTGANTLPFRGISVSYNSTIYPQFNLRPSGTYQSPSGFSLGVSNGTPASAMERIWVLENQYGHTWSVKAPTSNIVPAAPTNGVVDNDNDIFYYVLNPDYPLSEHEMSKNGAATFISATLPIYIGDVDLAAGQVQVRVRAGAGRDFSPSLSNATAFTKNTANNVFPSVIPMNLI